MISANLQISCIPFEHFVGSKITVHFYEALLEGSREDNTFEYAESIH